MADDLRIAVVGHTNAGKTALVRTLGRSDGFGELSDRPGTTRKAATQDLRLAEAPLLQLVDTPGFEDPAGLRDYLARMEELPAPVFSAPRLDALLHGPEARRLFDAEARALAAAREADAVLHVIDAREATLPKFRYELELLQALGKPWLPVLNFTAHPRSREAAWRALLDELGVRETVSFDAVSPAPGAQAMLYGALAGAARGHRSELGGLLHALEADARQRRARTAERIALLLVQAAAARDTIDKDAFRDAERRDDFVRAFKKRVVALERDCMADLLAQYRFRDDAALLDTPHAVADRWEADLFNPETLRQAGRHLTGGAAIGAGIGLAVDAAFAGLSLGAGAAIGAAIGGAASQGMTQFGRKVYHKMRGIQEISIADDVIAVMAQHMLAFAQALQCRTHADTARIVLRRLPGDADAAPLAPVVEGLAAARNYPDWAVAAGGKGDARRDRLVAETAQRLVPLLEAVSDGPT